MRSKWYVCIFVYVFTPKASEFQFGSPYLGTLNDALASMRVHGDMTVISCVFLVSCLHGTWATHYV